jgi:carbon-monoxide dehydrogenase medium subunit
MTPFELAEPQTVEEALALLDPDDDQVRPLSGGTALMLMMKAGVFRPKRLVSLRRLAKLSGIAATGEGGLAIGALTPLSDVERSAEVASRAPVTCARCGGFPMCGCAMSRPSAAISHMATRIWTCRRC